MALTLGDMGTSRFPPLYGQLYLIVKPDWKKNSNRSLQNVPFSRFLLLSPLPHLQQNNLEIPCDRLHAVPCKHTESRTTPGQQSSTSTQAKRAAAHTYQYIQDLFPIKHETKVHFLMLQKLNLRKLRLKRGNLLPFSPSYCFPHVLLAHTAQCIW